MSPSWHKWEIDRESDTFWHLLWVMIIASLGIEVVCLPVCHGRRTCTIIISNCTELVKWNLKNWITNIILIPWEKLLLILKSILIKSYLVGYLGAWFRLFTMNIYISINLYFSIELYIRIEIVLFLKVCQSKECYHDDSNLASRICIYVLLFLFWNSHYHKTPLR